MIKSRQDLEAIKKRMEPLLHLRKAKHKYRLMFRHNENAKFAGIENLIGDTLAQVYADKHDAVVIKIYDERVGDKVVLVVKESNRAVRYNVKNFAMVSDILNRHLGQNELCFEYIDVVEKEG